MIRLFFSGRRLYLHTTKSLNVVSEKNKRTLHLGSPESPSSLTSVIRSVLWCAPKYFYSDSCYNSNICTTFCTSNTGFIHSSAGLKLNQPSYTHNIHTLNPITRPRIGNLWIMAICSRVTPVWDFETFRSVARSGDTDLKNRCSQWTGPDVLVSVLGLSGNENP